MTIIFTMFKIFDAFRTYVQKQRSKIHKTVTDTMNGEKLCL